MPEPLWTPRPDARETSELARFCRLVGHSVDDPAALHRWSIDQPQAFWRAVWAFCGVRGIEGDRVLEHPEAMPGACWFPDARLNFAENLLRDCTNAVALVSVREGAPVRRTTRDELRRQVAAMSAALVADGMRPGDRVAALMPNIAETVVVMLACAAIGATFSSASPDFGVQGVVDRFGQIAPTLLFGVDSYVYGDRRIDCLDRLARIASRIPSLRRVIVCAGTGREPDLAPIPGGMPWRDFIGDIAAAPPIRFERFPFDHPLYVMYSSGTTGVPKCIVHGAGGTLLQHLKEHRLHCDIRDGDRVFYFSTCGWMMWNWLASGLASGATLLLYDGSPLARGGEVLWDLAESEACTHFGTSAKYLDEIAKRGIRPGRTRTLSALRVLLSTGSPLAPEAFDYVYREIKSDLQLSSISGGTDILGCFVLGNPNLPVWRGEIQGPGLGMAVEVWDETGRPAAGTKGELVCTRPFPSMPIGFWDDPGQRRYRAAYFERFPGVWCHGDFCETTSHGGYIIHGRSDATLNPGGVRIGTAEIYRQVERLDDIVESIAIAQRWPPGQETDVRIVLFVRLREGSTLDQALAERIRRTIRDNTTPRHVPAKIVQVDEIPRTRSGKLVELAVRSAVHGEPIANVEALQNPDALDQFRNRPELAAD